VRVALAVSMLSLAAPAVAVAREPVISYVDENGVFRLYDEEAESEVNPPPAVPAPANFLGFRYGMSQNGRYIVYNDDPAPRHLHLLDRATNTLLPLPGIDVYANPDNLAVSNNGLIAFDNQGNGPAVVYNSVTGLFVDTGLAADNAHRQTRLSGDGRFLATTCDSATKCAAPTLGADAFVQDLNAKSDTGFPADATRDEEHTCLNGPGSTVGFDKAASATDAKHDIFLFAIDESPPAPSPLPSEVNTPDEEEQYCVMDFTGRYLGFMNAFVTFMLWDRIDSHFVELPTDKEFDRYSVLSDPYPPPQQGGGAGPPPSGDRTKPVASVFRMARKRFRVKARATSFRFNLSEAADARILIWRLGKRVGTLRATGLEAGATTISFSGRIGGRKLRPGEYDAVLIVTDRAGNLSLPVFVVFKVLRPAGDRRR
jgi:hypothetical protein